jgi:hypothetical protein
MGSFSWREKDRMRGRDKKIFCFDSLTLAFSRRERELLCPTPKFLPNSIASL